MQTKNKSKVNVKVINNLSIDTSESSEIKIYGRPKITIKKFEDDAVLIKKPIQ